MPTGHINDRKCVPGAKVRATVHRDGYKKKPDDDIELFRSFCHCYCFHLAESIIFTLDFDATPRKFSFHKVNEEVGCETKQRYY